MPTPPPPPCPWTVAQIAAALSIESVDAGLILAEIEVLPPSKGAKVLRDALAAKGIPCNAAKLSLAWRGGIPLHTALALMRASAEAEAGVRAPRDSGCCQTSGTAEDGQRFLAGG